MKPLYRRITESLCLMGVLFFIFGGRPAEFGETGNFFQGYLISRPIIKVSLGINLSDVRISASAGMKVYEAQTSYSLLAEDVDEVIVKGKGDDLTERFKVLVCRFDSGEEAEDAAIELEERFNRRFSVSQVSDEGAGDSGGFEVTADHFITRGEALEFIDELSRDGIDEAWIIRYEIAAETRPFWILVGDNLTNLDQEAVLYFIPSGTHSYLSFKGRDYHGIFILRSSPEGMVLVNLLNLENYLKSVVPSELSPSTFNEMEAHKAQAVAARTYALKNISIDNGQEYDLCDTPRSQFYKGIAAEHPFSTAAVNATRGEVVVYNDRLIDALYTSTCGGRTEDVENVFGGPALPYLKSMECAYESRAEWELKSERTILPVMINHRDVSREIAVLAALDIIPEMDPIRFVEEIPGTEAAEWIRRTEGFLRKREASTQPAPGMLTVEGMTRSLVDLFQWQETAAQLIQDSEREYLLRGISNIRDEDSRELAYLIQSGILPSRDDIRDVRRAVLRGEFASALGKALMGKESIMHSGNFSHAKDNKIAVRENGGDSLYSLGSKAFLLVRIGEGYAVKPRVYMIGGEGIHWIEKDGRMLFLEVDQPFATNLLERGSKYHRWNVRISAERLERRINRYYPIGRLKDIQPLKRGSSQRVIELLVKGSEQDVLVEGFRIRNILGLKETLFVMDRIFGSDLIPTEYVFNGRGWGHGVGLCQVGAFGMARAGASYREILKKYYQGVKVKKIY